MKRALIASILFAAATASAQDTAPEPTSPTTKPGTIGIVSPFDTVKRAVREARHREVERRKKTNEATAADVANAPLPGAEAGRIDEGEHDSTLRNVGQGVLAVPKFALDVVFAPVRGGLWAYEHYSIGSRVHRATFDRTDTYGVYPTLVVDSTYGVTLGGRFVHRNLFGAREKFAARAAFGGEFAEIVNGVVKTGDRLGDRATLELGGEFERRPRDTFYGIGNEGDGNIAAARHRQQLERASTTLDLRGTDDFHVRMAGALTDLEYGVAKEGTPIDQMYDVGMLTGWTGTRNLYSELELRYDSRRVSTSLEQKGVLLDAFAGRVYQLEAGHDYWRYGGEAIHFLPLGVGRTLATRAHLESVTGALNDVAFTQLPQL
ncbi:MAG TPA: hypothetical protein VIV40_30635, partial [Kofleriaceae bacterium]